MDRENVIKGIECLLSDKKCDLRKCSYGEFSNCINKVLSDALELLKEQEAIIEQYRRADGFLAAHGWKWEGR